MTFKRRAGFDFEGGWLYEGYIEDSRLGRLERNFFLRSKCVVKGELFI